MQFLTENTKILFVGGTYIKTNNTPEWNDFHKCFYVDGNRWIKSKKNWSTQCRTMLFKSFAILTEEEIKNLGGG